MRESYTAVIARNEEWSGDWTTEPYEAAWAAEGIVFVRILKVQGLVESLSLEVQISPDGIRWVGGGEPTEISTTQELSFVRLSHFGGWLRLRGVVRGGGSLRVMAYLSLKA
jgi:hypothetical protein